MAGVEISLHGKRALVTGGSSGIGLAAGRALARAGADVTLVARSAGKLAHAVEALAAEKLTVRSLPLDVGDYDAVHGAIAPLAAFHILVNNAGIHKPQPFLDIDIASFDALFRVNVRGAFAVAQAVTRRMVAETTHGVVINTSSQLGHVGASGRAVYAATKHALEGLSKSMALDLAPHNIRVVTISPTFTDTEMTRRILPQEQRSAMTAGLPIGRFAMPEEIAATIVFLASDHAALITGSSVMLDGGWTAQ